MFTKGFKEENVKKMLKVVNYVNNIWMFIVYFLQIFCRFYIFQNTTWWREEEGVLFAVTTGRQQS